MPILPNKNITIDIYNNAIRVELCDNNTLKGCVDIYEISEAGKAYLSLLQWKIDNLKTLLANHIEVDIRRGSHSRWDYDSHSVMRD